eukprot:TRINITY_DN481_c0_g1_i13.p1 TRINITY_DN481_c0_g1~~TRINITY_DN481_c0_g1_i13.p1  ORF type:complete len:478 (+),score=117.58 TRINITY_DN481_c0_g1_i13:710-2143(+)
MTFNTRISHNIRNILLVVTALFSAVYARAFFSDWEHLTPSDTSLSFPLLKPSVRTSKITKSVIKFAVFGGKAKLYVNGKKQNPKPGLLNKVELSLNKNDIIAFKCSKTGSPSKMAGLMASITHNGKVYRTGLSRFTTRGDFSKWNTWEKQSWDKLKLYNDKKSGAKHDFCHWKQAHIVASKWNKFDTKASFIWRLTGKQNKQAARSVFIRFVVGGEMCSGDQRTGGTPKNDDDEDDDSEGKGKKTRKGDDDDGDNDDDEGKSKKKGRKDDEDDDDDDDEGKSKKKGRKADGDDNDDDDEGKSKKKSSDDDDDDDDHERKSKKKKSNKGDDDDEGDDDQKDRKKSTKKDNEDNDDDEHNKPSGRVPHPKDDDDDDNDKKHKYGDESELRGQSDESKPDHFCACQLTTRRGGECYDMEDNTASSGRCRPRPCEPKFECVASGDKMCVKRRGGTKVVMVSPNNCKVEAVDDIEMLLPYEG